MSYARKTNHSEEVRQLFKDGRKKFVTLPEGAALYSIGLNRFRDIAYEAKATYHIGRSVLVNVTIIDEYMENFRD